MRTIFVGIDGTTPDPVNNVRFEKWDFDYSFIYMMKVYCAASDDDKIHIAGPNMYGEGTSTAVKEALEFLTRRLRPPFVKPRIIVAGYSRGAYAALRVAQALGLIGFNVDFLGLIDVVKCTDDMTETNISGNIRAFIGEKSNADIWRENLARRGIDLQKNPQAVMGMVPELREIERKDAKRAAELSNQVNRSPLPNAISWGVGDFAVPKNVKAGFHARRDAKLGSRTYPMGHYPLTGMGKEFEERRDFFCTHSAMGGMPFRGDTLKEATRLSEWHGTRAVGHFIVKNCTKHGVLTKHPYHPVLAAPAPPSSWYRHENIRSQYRLYMRQFQSRDGTGLDDGQRFEDYYLDKSTEQYKKAYEVHRSPI